MAHWATGVRHHRTELETGRASLSPSPKAKPPWPQRRIPRTADRFPELDRLGVTQAVLAATSSKGIPLSPERSAVCTHVAKSTRGAPRTFFDPANDSQRTRAVTDCSPLPTGACGLLPPCFVADGGVHKWVLPHLRTCLLSPFHRLPGGGGRSSMAGPVLKTESPAPSTAPWAHWVGNTA